MRLFCALCFAESESRGLMFRYFRGAEFQGSYFRFSFRKMHQNPLEGRQPASRIGEEWLRTSRAYGYVRSALRGEEPSFVVLDFESTATSGCCRCSRWVPGVCRWHACLEPAVGLKPGTLSRLAKSSQTPGEILESRIPQFWGPILLRVLYTNPH